MDKPDDVLDENRAVFLEDGPRLSYRYKTACAARCPTGKHVLHTGLGSMGCGSMWTTASEEERTDPDWETLPVEQCGRGIPEHLICKTETA